MPNPIFLTDPETKAAIAGIDLDAVVAVVPHDSFILPNHMASPQAGVVRGERKNGFVILSNGRALLLENDSLSAVMEAWAKANELEIIPPRLPEFCTHDKLLESESCASCFAETKDANKRVLNQAIVVMESPA